MHRRNGHSALLLESAPATAQALRVTRRIRSLHGQRWRTVTVYAVTNLTAAQARPARLADWIRGH